MMTNGVLGSVTPATSTSAAITWASYQIDGISTLRCGSLARSGLPVAVRDPARTHPWRAAGGECGAPRGQAASGAPGAGGAGPPESRRAIGSSAPPRDQGPG